jgi:hypothetical protein
MDHLLIIIGCAKCGTSALAQMLDAQPAFRRGTHKETKFFCDLSYQDWTGPGAEGFLHNLETLDEFHANFDLKPGQWAIDASTDYIWFPRALDKISAFAETRPVKLICLVRDPISRAVSEYNHTIRAGWETLSFAHSLEAEADRFAKGYQPLFYHQRRSTISADIARYRDRFGDDVLILDYAAMNNPDGVLQTISDFIGVTPAPYTPLAPKNQSLLPRNKLLAGMLKNDRLRGLARGLVPQALRAKLWDAMHTNARNLQTVSPAEKDMLRDLLKDEIAACLAADYIPTENWREALGQHG